MYNGHKVIDADGHVQEPADLWDRYIAPEYFDFRPRCDAQATDNMLVVQGLAMSRSFVREPGSGYRDEIVKTWNATYPEEFARGTEGFNSDSYIKAMDEEGMEVMVLYPGRGLYACGVEYMDGGLSAAICRAYNQWLHDFCQRDPDRLVGVALGALHDPELAAEEIRYAVEELGMRGCMIRPNPYNGRNLDDPAYDVFYAEVARLGVPLATHEGSGTWMPQYGDRYKSFLAQHAMCHPMEQMGAVYSLTAGGIMERHPTLQVAVLETGGTWLPYWLYRLDEHYEELINVESETGHLTQKPSDYFRRQGWIGCEPDEPGLRGLVDCVGADRILWASDYPHPDAKFPGVLKGLSVAEENGLTPDEIRLYAYENSKRLYGLTNA